MRFHECLFLVYFRLSTLMSFLIDAFLPIMETKTPENASENDRI